MDSVTSFTASDERTGQLGHALAVRRRDLRRRTRRPPRARGSGAFHRARVLHGPACSVARAQRRRSTRTVTMRSGGADKMSRNRRASFGPLAAILLAAGITGLAFLVPGYDPVRQIVSEIGEVGSPMQLPFTVLLCAVAACLLIFASGVRRVARLGTQRACGLFHRDHGVFRGRRRRLFVSASAAQCVRHVRADRLSGAIGVRATWRGDRSAASLVRLSWLMGVLVWIAIALNLATLDRHGALFAFERPPFYGLVQRALFFAWFGWVAIAGVMLRSARLQRST